MRILHVLRSDYATHTGGDLVQLRAYVATLQALGIDAIAARVDDDVAIRPDVVHYYNLYRAIELKRALAIGSQRWPRARTVVSPVYWPEPLVDVVQAYGRDVRQRALKCVIKGAAHWRTHREILSRADAICPNSDIEGARLAGRFRLPRDARWLTVFNGLRLDRWPLRSGPPPRREALGQIGLDRGLDRLVVCVARIETRKNQLALVEAVRRLPGTGLALIGPIDEAAYARRVAAAARAMGRVAFVGLQPQEALAELLVGADVHVLPSLYETPGLATLEAAAVGCEVVVTPGGSAAEYLGDLGHVARSVRPAHLVAAIEEATSSPTQPAMRHRVERYDWREAGPALLRAYEVAMSRRPR